MTKINFVGDVALFCEFERQSIDPLLNVVLPASDFNVCNFEFPVSRLKIKKFYDASNEYITSYSYIESLKLEKFDLYGLANNHINDYGIEGIETTKEVISSSGVNYFGLNSDGQYDIHFNTINNINFAFVAAVKNGRWRSDNGTEGPNIIDYEKLNQLVCELHKRTEIDHIILFFHWGTELVDAPIEDDISPARKLIEIGASCIIGHHPHVAQGIECVNNGLIAYSLGSFIYLSEFEKGNYDNVEIRDMSICLNIEFSKDSIVAFTPHRYIRNSTMLVPKNSGDFKDDKYFSHLNSAIGNSKYYSSQVRKVLLKRELISFWLRFKENPLTALVHYAKYIKFTHLKKILGVSK